MDDEWRRIDVDKYDPDTQFVPDDLGLPQRTLEEVNPQITEIRQYVSKNLIADAVKTATLDPPYGSDADVKQSYLYAVLEVLNTARQTEVPQIIAGLSLEQVDTLVKFIYALMATPEGQKSGGVLLGWLDKVVDHVGEGPIVRYFTDPYTL